MNDRTDREISLTPSPVVRADLGCEPIDWSPAHAVPIALDCEAGWPFVFEVAEN